MNDVGIDLLKPRYDDKRLLVAADIAYWEVLYTDGSVLSEAAGAIYPQIDRSRLASWRLVHLDEIVFQLFLTDGRTGHDLIYRRRTSLGPDANGPHRSVVYIVGFSPMGPLFAVDLDRGEYREDTAGLLPTLTPMPGEPDDLLLLPA